MLAGVIEAAIEVAQISICVNEAEGIRWVLDTGRKCRASSILGFPRFERMGVLTLLVVS
jgi:hypothetical protein